MYEGSMTSPPCEKFTTWFVVEKPIYYSYSGIEMLKAALNPPTPNELATNPDA
jgi:carbonic anhydrase